MTEQQSNSTGLQVQGVSVYYGQHQALNQVSLYVKPGEIVVILGGNGAGKSSMLQTIAGLVPRAGGSIQLDDKPLSALKPHQIVEAGLALVPEGRGIFGDLTVEENLILGAYAQRARKHEQQNLERIYSLFPKLVERRKQIARTMSGGEQQMVAIGRAMMSSPSILMLDEPSLGLSPLLASDVFKTLKVVQETGLGILLVEQNAKQSLSIADRGYLIETGQITAENAASALMQDPAVQAAYLGGAKGGAKTGIKAGSKEGSGSTVRSAAGVAAAAPESAGTGVKSAGKAASIPVPGHYEPQRVNVAQVLGHSVSDAIRDAEERQKAQWRQPAAQSPAAAPSAGQERGGSALSDMLRRMETAAAAAGTIQVRSAPRADAPRRKADALTRTEAPREEPQPEIEIYRPPTLEVYRREADDTGRGALKLIKKTKV